MKPRLLCSLVLVLLLSAAALGGDVASQVLRIQVGQTYGSGAYLGARLVLTCAHLFAAESARTGDAWFPDGSHYTWQARAIDGHWDQALLELAQQPPHSGLPLASENPRPGESVQAWGYGKTGQVHVTSGRVIGYSSASRQDPADWVEISGRVEEGSSGGPLTNERGEVIGNLWGTAEDPGVYQSVGLCCGRTRRFLFPWNAQLEAVQLQLAQNCPGGMCPLPQTPRVRLAPRGSVPQLIPLPSSSAPSTAAPPATTTPPATDVAPAEQRIDYAHLAELLKADPVFLAAVKGPPGEKGEKGDKGDRGEQGDAGEASAPTAIDTAALAAAIAQALPGITVRTIDSAGQVLDSEEIPLGGVLNIHHRPLQTK